MGLIRIILAFVILLILVHVGLVYADIGQQTNRLTNAVYSLAILLEAPATLLLEAVSSTGRVDFDPSSFYTVALTAAAGYFVLYLLFGVGRGRVASASVHAGFACLSARAASTSLAAACPSRGFLGSGRSPLLKRGWRSLPKRA